jgi:co-chaperonin GroES (HSP10)
MSLRLLGDRVLVEVIMFKRQSAGGIVLPGNSDKPLRGRVAEVGPGIFFLSGEQKKLQVKKGDIVLFAGGEAVESGGKHYVMLDESDIMAVEKI